MDLNDEQIISRIKAFAGLNVLKIRPLAENNYCRILQAETPAEPFIVKHYKTPESELAQLEAAGVDVYHGIAANDASLTDSRALFVDHELNLVGISFVKGQCFANFIYDNSRQSAHWPKITAPAHRLGQLLRQFRDATRNDGSNFSPFHAEYILYCSRILSRLPLLGPALFNTCEKSAVELSTCLQQNLGEPSFAHGDFVFRNIHIDEGRVGLIDFANCLNASHTLNDLFNMWFALHNTLIPAELQRLTWASLIQGLGKVDFAEPLLQFFFEFHRRRWLMLNLSTRDPRRWFRAFRGLKSFARSFAAVRKDLGI